MCPFTDITRGSAEKATKECGYQIGFDVHLENVKRKGRWLDVLFLDKDPHEVDDLRQVEEDKETTKSEEKGNRE